MSEHKKQELVQDGREIYKKIESQLVKKKHKGAFVAIDPKSEDYFVGNLPIDAINLAKKKYPRRMFYMTKIAEPNYLPIR